MAASFEKAVRMSSADAVPASGDGLEWNPQKYDLEEKWFPTKKMSEQEKYPDVESSGTNSPIGDRPAVDGNDADCSANDEITYHYLTFATELPPPSQQTPTAPEMPDLSRYTNPFWWSPARKNVFVVLSCLATASAAYIAGAYAYAVPFMMAEWHISEVVSFVGITLFTAGFGAAPMVLAPLSEINGRRPVFLVAGYLFLVFSVVCAATPTFAGMLIARFFAGCMSSTFSTMVGGVLADIYVNADRNTPMTLYTGAVFLATGLGPLISGFIAQNINWRWIFGVHCIYVAVLVAGLTFYFGETRGSVLLSRKAKALNKWYDAREAAGFYGVDINVRDTTLRPSEENTKARQSQRIRWKVRADEERTSIQRMIAISCYRPFHLLATEPVVFFFSLWVSFSWGILYMMFEIIPYMYQHVYGFTVQQSGAAFATVCVACVIATFLNIYGEKFAMRSGKFSGNPEARLYFSCVQSTLLPVGIFLFGWTSRADIPWIVPAIGIAFATIGIFSTYLATFNYLADCYGRYASSAIAAQSACRNYLCGAFPLFTRQMFVHMGNGYGNAATMLGCIGVALSIVPWVLAFYGKKIRAKSKICSEEMQN